MYPFLIVLLLLPVASKIIFVLNNFLMQLKPNAFLEVFSNHQGQGHPNPSHSCLCMIDINTFYWKYLESSIIHMLFFLMY